MSALLHYLPRGNTLDDEVWGRRHLFLQWLLLLHIPSLFLFGILTGNGVNRTSEVLVLPLACLIVSRLLQGRRARSFFVTAGLSYCSAALVLLSHGSIEAHFHLFVMVGFIALYQDWVPFLWMFGFTLLSHGLGSAFESDLIFNHHAAQAHPWLWSTIHALAVLAACVGAVIFWKNTEDEQQRSSSAVANAQQHEAEVRRQQFASNLLVNLARRNQNLLYRQLELLNQLEEHEPDPDALADLFRLDHLATRIRRNAESLLVLAGEEPARKWGRPVHLVDVVRAAIAEIEDLDRVDFMVDESLAISGRAVADITHLIAELVENAVNFSPPGIRVMVRSRPYLVAPGAQALTIEDWGVGMSREDLARANEILSRPQDVDLSVSQQLGLHVVSRLAARYGIAVSLNPTPGGGVTAVALLPEALFAEYAEHSESTQEMRYPAIEPVLAGAVTRDIARFGAPSAAGMGMTATREDRAAPAAAVQPWTGAQGAPNYPPTGYPTAAGGRAQLPSAPPHVNAAPYRAADPGWSGAPRSGPDSSVGSPGWGYPAGTGGGFSGRPATPAMFAPFGFPPAVGAPDNIGDLAEGMSWHSWWTPHRNSAAEPVEPVEPAHPTTRPGGAAGRDGATDQAATPAETGPDEAARPEPAANSASAVRHQGQPQAGPAEGPAAAAAGAPPPAGPPNAGRPELRPAAVMTQPVGGAPGPQPGPQPGQPGLLGPSGQAGRAGPDVSPSAGAGSLASVRPSGPSGPSGPTGPGAGSEAAAVAESMPATAGPDAGAAAAEQADAGLARRVPQASLAAELRRDSSEAPAPAAVRDPNQARAALSRFQASQRVARAMFDEPDRTAPPLAPQEPEGRSRQ